MKQTCPWTSETSREGRQGQITTWSAEMPTRDGSGERGTSGSDLG